MSFHPPLYQDIPCTPQPSCLIIFHYTSARVCQKHNKIPSHCGLAARAATRPSTASPRDCRAQFGIQLDTLGHLPFRPTTCYELAIGYLFRYDFSIPQNCVRLLPVHCAPSRSPRPRDHPDDTPLLRKGVRRAGWCVSRKEQKTQTHTRKRQCVILK